ncbi:MAG: DUF4383 domain-containing protein [Chroococcales cyanobacterium]
MGKRYFALIIGIFYVLIGIMGFIPNLVTLPAASAPPLLFNTGYGYLMGLFPINLLHNLVHLGIGIWGIIAYRSFDNSRLFCRATAIFYGLLAVMGLLPFMNTTFGVIPIFGNDVWLHAATAIVAAYFGFIVPTAQEARAAH